MIWYINLVSQHPILSSMVQFAILGTFGDMMGKWIAKDKVYMPFPAKVFFLKILEWAFLGILIKYAFIGFHGFVDSLVFAGLFPAMKPVSEPFFYALTVSITINLQFGPFLVIIHRFLDNIIMGKPNWDNLSKGFLSLLWFWIPAHTITFMLPKHYQIGLAALWSIVLGIILGFYNSKKEKF